MNFLLSTYIHPLASPIPISNHFSFFFDNPRSEEEIAFISSFLENEYKNEDSFRLPVEEDSQYLSIRLVLKKFRACMKNLDPYVEDFFLHTGADVFRTIAEMWIVIRFDDQGELNKMHSLAKEYKLKDLPNVQMLEETSPAFVNSEKLANYAYLLTLLFNSQGKEYFGGGFLLAPDRIGRRTIFDYPWFHVLWMAFASRDLSKDQNTSEFADWRTFYVAKPKIIDVATALEKLLSSGKEEKLLYIGSILRLVSEEVTDVKVRLVLLTSIIELLLTHSPDVSRFNVEDSISRQFSSKTTSVIYQQEKTYNLDMLSKRLKTIYRLRSLIAHGEFNEITKYLAGLPADADTNEDLDSLVADLFYFIRIILEKYIADPAYIEFLKTN